ncbi:alpha/beta fold hydrolase [Rhodoferax aquaticus]|uniref:Alpha/beta fold hydrolase n=1 Tax=Rhodoferax aquaticus TaxID=2527691 RepID=A0A515ER57_9BURK|nr:alpha/beta fold hydrolase [Rhodoferax aquaticus]QDL55157.1 alpha/beta fold hydrolase [Rhodoferax aquaticus]
MKIETEFDVEYQETGKGDAIVFVPGSFLTGSSWRPIASPLSERYRTITTSLSGYGKTQERRTPGGKHMEDQMDVLEAVLKKVDAPAHLVAHSFGAYCALLLAIRRPCNLLSLTFFEPTVFGLLALSNEAALHQDMIGTHAPALIAIIDDNVGRQQSTRS